jgi:RecB family exonuclease
MTAAVGLSVKGGAAAAAPALTARVETEIASVLSPSQAKTFIGCPAKWYFRYVERLPEYVTGALAVGRAVHRALEVNFRQKLSSRTDLAAAELLPVFEGAAAEEFGQADLREEEDPAELKDVGCRCVLKYMQEAAPAIQPALIEHPVSGAIGGVEVRGYVDLMDVEGRIIDLKTSAKKPAGISADYKLQLATYAAITPGACGLCRLDTLTKQKTVQLVHQTYHADDAAERLYIETMYPIVQDGMKDGRYWPVRDGHLCSRKYCSFWRVCEREFGGTVNG